MHVARRQSKAITWTYASISALLLVVIAALAIVFVPPAPPSVAEFAPQASDEITEAPNNQSSRFGAGGDGVCIGDTQCEGSAVTAGGRAPATIIEKARVRRCVGDPPRQTEDPQSPPCVGYWEGDNGGSTAPGVTRDEIRVAWAYQGQIDAPVRAIVDHFNRRYEFYGRKIRAFAFGVPGDWNDPAVQRSIAERVADEVKAFAATELVNVKEQSAYRNELSRRGVLSVGQDLPGADSSDLRSKRPYQWSYAPPLDEKLRNLAEMACRSLVGRPASYGGPDVALSQRSFAAVRPRSPGKLLEVEALQSRLADCGVDLKVREYGDIQIMLAELRGSGTTTIIPLVPEDWYPLYTGATSQRYFPEWLVAPGRELEYETQSLLSDQSAHMFGIAAKNKLMPVSDDPFFWAIRESEPQFQPAVGTSRAAELSEIYRNLMPLAAGIQMAGPRLNASTIERGLHSTRFPNPSPGQAPNWQASVGFHGDYSMVEDYAAFWWSLSERRVRGGPTGDTGTYCYIDRGARWSTGKWPTGELPFFDRTRPCR